MKLLAGLNFHDETHPDYLVRGSRAKGKSKATIKALNHEHLPHHHHHHHHHSHPTTTALLDPISLKSEIISNSNHLIKKHLPIRDKCDGLLMGCENLSSTTRPSRLRTGIIRYDDEDEDDESLIESSPRTS